MTDTTTDTTTDTNATTVRIHEAGAAIEERLREEVTELEKKERTASGPLKEQLGEALRAKRAHLEDHVRRAADPNVVATDPHRRTRAEIDAETARLR